MRLTITRSLFLLLFSLTGFGQSNSPKTLDDCIQIGLEHNQSLKLNRFETDRSVSQAKSNIAMVLPVVSFSLSGGSSDVFGVGWNESYSNSLTLSQNIWDGGAWWNTLKSAKVAQDAATIQYDSYEVNTVYQVKAAYYSYLSTQQLLDVYRENQTTSEYQHQLTLERFKLGAASQNDTLRTRVNIENSRLQIINGQVDLKSKSRNLNIILGREADATLTLAEPIWEEVEVPTVDQITDEVLNSNHSLKLLDQNKEIMAYNVKIARSGYMPSLGFSASYRNNAAGMGDIFGESTSTKSAGLLLSWNLFNGTRTSRGVEQGKINAKMADENYDLSVRKLRKELAQTLEQMNALKESVKISQLILTASEQDLLLAQEQYKIGSLSILDVLRITASYEDAKSNFIRTQHNLKVAEAGLLQLMGKR
ncbi:MAG: TolC family protein [Candidatus Marinimicrobia bacterium]|jgi:outer membrane protein|nr:TolC family protein [Candidatus Neomarinimicrobiota bacterium]MBT4714134.1 TolC family protein [Candidatus Neomarinimicrobiota bacterium]MBT4946025.1 TolC family protein [Candidatus Neomarinimicrobiota bacterium]MBT5270883.1 TolC family protein [Candidatus Neomarinimicrobiota bacterium]MBT6011917.1 TolC family protein [Candidatus Neomarinimicrobiota bacterium]